jgi:hypothetical protein
MRVSASYKMRVEAVDWDFAAPFYTSNPSQPEEVVQVPPDYTPIDIGDENASYIMPGQSLIDIKAWLDNFQNLYAEAEQHVATLPPQDQEDGKRWLQKLTQYRDFVEQRYKELADLVDYYGKQEPAPKTPGPEVPFPEAEGQPPGGAEQAAAINQAANDLSNKVNSFISRIQNVPEAEISQKPNVFKREFSALISDLISSVNQLQPQVDALYRPWGAQ